MDRRRIALAALVVAGGAVALTFALSRVGSHERATGRSNAPTVTIKAPRTTPAWMVSIASRKAREVTKSAPTTGVITKRRLTYEVLLHGDFTWLACDPCARSGPLPVAIQDSIVFRGRPR